MKDVTALIKTFLRDDYLFDCVQSLHSLYPEMPILVADDGFVSDEKEERLRGMGVTKYIRMGFDSGLSAGRNTLVDHCETPYALLCDDDHSFLPDTKVERLRTLMGVADIAAGGFLENSGAYHYFANFTRYPDGRFALVEANQPNPLPEYEGIRYVKCDLTHNVFVARTEVLRKVKWDSNLRIRFEHEDFFMSAWLEKVKVVYCIDVLVPHKRQGYPRSTEYHGHRSNTASSEMAFKEKWGFLWN
jgi:GT2 family glycosyltransferase